MERPIKHAWQLKAARLESGVNRMKMYTDELVDWHAIGVDHDVVDQLRNRRDLPEGWQGMSEYKRALLHLFDEACSQDYEYPEGLYKGQGIVTCASAKSGHSSGKDLKHGYFPGAWSMLKEVRRLGCNLPVTFAYLGFEEFAPNLMHLIEPHNATSLDLRWLDWFTNPMRILAGWESKIAAIMACPYEEVLFMDADNIPVSAPDYLFTQPAYLEHGAMFWGDLGPSTKHEWLPKEVWDAIGVAKPDNYLDFESGQLLINKRKCWKALNVCRHINEYSDYYYKIVFGDKSTFFLAWHKLGQSYAIPRRPGWGGKAIFQYDMDGDLMFQHACQDKPTLNGYGHHGFFVNERHVHGHVAELAEMWDGHMWHWTDTFDEDVMEFHAGKYHYERLGMDDRPLELKPDGTVGEGSAWLEDQWRIHESPDHGACLVLYAVDKMPSAVLARHDGQWWGQWLHFEKCRIRMEKLNADQTV